MKTTINLGYIIFLSVVAALGGFLFGYDTAVISGTIAQVTHLFQLDTLQQGWLCRMRIDRIDCRCSLFRNIKRQHRT